MDKEPRTRTQKGRNRILLSLIVCLVLTSMLAFPRSVNADDPPASTGIPNLPTPTLEAPLKITFPKAASHPHSGWRPPLFPIPFALGPHDHFYFDRPIAVTAVNWPLPNYRYGYKDSETNSPHTGVDIDAPLHTPILAAADGKVVFTGYGLALGGGNKDDPYGLAVVIRHNFSFHGDSLLTVYAHMEKITVKVGQVVHLGDELGLVGLTGNTSGPHVHFEIRLETGNAFTVQNPELWMVPPTDSGVLVGQLKDVYGNYLTDRTVYLQSEATGQNWTLTTYASQQVRNDPYYKENLVVGDLPAGKYKITFLNNYQYNKYEVTITPGAITFVTYVTGKGFASGTPSQSDGSSFLIPFTN